AAWRRELGLTFTGFSTRLIITGWSSAAVASFSDSLTIVSSERLDGILLSLRGLATGLAAATERSGFEGRATGGAVRATGCLGFATFAERGIFWGGSKDNVIMSTVVSVSVRA